jgi:hypothetical protein
LSAQAMEIVRTKDTGTLQYDIYFNDDQSECIVLELALFSLKVLGGEQLRRVVAEAKERRYYEVPLRVGEYDRLPDMDAVGSFRPGGE